MDSTKKMVQQAKMRSEISFLMTKKRGERRAKKASFRTFFFSSTILLQKKKFGFIFSLGTTLMTTEPPKPSEIDWEWCTKNKEHARIIRDWRNDPVTQSVGLFLE